MGISVEGFEDPIFQGTSGISHSTSNEQKKIDGMSFVGCVITKDCCRCVGDRKGTFVIGNFVREDLDRGRIPKIFKNNHFLCALTGACKAYYPGREEMRELEEVIMERINFYEYFEALADDIITIIHNDYRNARMDKNIIELSSFYHDGNTWVCVYYRIYYRKYEKKLYRIDLSTEETCMVALGDAWYRSEWIHLKREYRPRTKDDMLHAVHDMIARREQMNLYNPAGEPLDYLELEAKGR